MRSSVVALLKELVAIQSLSGAEQAAADFAAHRLAAAGLDVERVGDNVIAHLVSRGRGRGRAPALLFASHLDTVPAGVGWTRDPFAASEEAGRIHGRGANDAKASVAAMMTALEDLASHRARDAAAGTLLLALTVEEETTNAGIAAVRRHLVDRGLDGAVVGEPTSLEVVRAQSGLAVLRAEWTGRSCHAAHVARVTHESALAKAATELAAAGEWLALDGSHPLLGTSTVTPTIFRAGERANVVPDRAEATFDARLAPPHDAAGAVRALAARLPSAKVEIRSERLKAVETPADHPLVVAALQAAGRSQAIGSPTLSDMALLGGIPAVKVGPGDTARSHTPDEFVTVDELEAGFRFYRALARLALEALSAAPAAGRSPGAAFASAAGPVAPSRAAASGGAR
ncbi:MAG: M20/M25/M40 family metallo-hydrolase [bacterium]